MIKSIIEHKAATICEATRGISSPSLSAFFEANTEEQR